MNRIRWLINRIRVMTVPEIMFRIRRYFAQKLEQCRVAVGWQPQPGVCVKPRASLFGHDAGLISKWRQSRQLDHFKLQEYIEGRINFLGNEPLNVGNPVAWHREPVTGIELPRTFGKALNYRDDRIVGNVKFIWELGRHQHLVSLAVAYAVTGEARYRQAVVQQIDGWIEENPYGIGIHWCSALEVALRLISWSIVHSLLALRDGEPGLFRAVRDPETLGRVIYQQVHFVRFFLSLHSSANNHLIGELTGLWVACQVFDFGRDGKDWSEFAKRSLEQEANLQVYSDGVDKEQAFYYHLWVLEYFLFVWLVGHRTESPLSEEFLQHVVAMAHFLKDIRPNGGEPPQVGDADDGFVSRFEPTWPKRPYSELLDTVDAVFGSHSTGATQKPFWYQAILGGNAAQKQCLDWERSYPVEYREGGYAILGGAGCHLIFDGGDLGYLGIAAHGHADALSFCLAFNGEWWLVDPGTYAYHSEFAWRNYFRSTKAHNTITINDEDQSVSGGAFMWLRKAHAWIEAVSEKGGVQYARACHDGYGHVGVSHCREIHYSIPTREFKIVDNLVGGRSLNAAIYFHFAPDVKLTFESKSGDWVAVRPNSKCRLTIRSVAPWEFSVLTGETDPILGWYSPAMEKRIESSTLCGKTVLSGELKSVIRMRFE